MNSQNNNIIKDMLHQLLYQLETGEAYVIGCTKEVRFEGRSKTTIEFDMAENTNHINWWKLKEYGGWI